MQIELDDGTLIYAPWDDDECIRKVNAELRFDIGTKVQCWYEEKWQKGRVVQHDYEEPHGVSHPYQIELHDDVLIYAPRDDDEYSCVISTSRLVLVCAPWPWEGWHVARPVYHDTKAVTFIAIMATLPTGYSLLRPQ